MALCLWLMAITTVITVASIRAPEGNSARRNASALGGLLLHWLWHIFLVSKTAIGELSPCRTNT